MIPMFELTAHTEPGARLVSLAETLADDLASRAPLHDREASFPHASVDALKRALLPLGLPASDEFWSAPAQRWTQARAWSGEKFAIDHALAP